MTATTELRTISSALRRACLNRWTNDTIIDGVYWSLSAGDDPA